MPRHAGGSGNTQGEVLADRFRSEGYDVVAVSHAPNRYARLVDVAATLSRRLRAIDVVLLQVYGGASFVVEDLASWLVRTARRPLVMHLRGGGLPDFLDRHPVWARRMLARADAVVAPSRFLVEAVRRHGMRAREIPNVVDVQRYPFRERSRIRPRLLWMRRFHALYNPLLAVRVLARIRERVPEATLAMAGDDKGLEAVARAEAVRLGVEGAVDFVGYLDLPGKVRVGSAADVFLNTNRVDNTPVSVIEAAALGLPVVATDVGGIRWLLRDGETGLLVPDDDERAMAAAVLRLMGEPCLTGRLSREGRAAAERCAWSRVRSDWESLFSGLLSGGPLALREGHP